MEEKTLVDVLNEHKINKSEFCRRAGLSRTALFLIKRDSAPSIHTAKAINDAFKTFSVEVSCWDYINKRS